MQCVAGAPGRPAALAAEASYTAGGAGGSERALCAQVPTAVQQARRPRVMRTQAPCFVLVALACQARAPTAAAARKNPHIILSIIDDLGWNDLGFRNNHEIDTPHLNQLAGAGVILHSYYVQSSCSPTRASILLPSCLAATIEDTHDDSTITDRFLFGSTAPLLLLTIPLLFFISIVRVAVLPFLGASILTGRLPLHHGINSVIDPWETLGGHPQVQGTGSYSLPLDELLL
eukprot:COSAG01_NODE_2296_length_7966_cov_270.955765_1_plen_230_part_10